MPSHYSVITPDIECQGCANSIRNALARVPGVRKVDVDVEQKRVDVEYEPGEVDETALADRLTHAGFPPGRS